MDIGFSTKKNFQIIYLNVNYSWFLSLRINTNPQFFLVVSMQFQSLDFFPVQF